jgi:cysteine-rich repeat protein
MRYHLVLIAGLLGSVFARRKVATYFPTTSSGWLSPSGYASSSGWLSPSGIASPSGSPTYTRPMPSHTGDCGSECGGVCGDGIVQYPYEECDLGPKLNGAPNSGCSKDCKRVPWCGDGVVNAPGETCDLGWRNGVAGSGCSANCTRTAVCGNGIIETGEECDAGSSNGAYDSGCSEDCKLCGYCGDGIIDDAAGETCDDGPNNGNPTSNCDAWCHKKPTNTGVCDTCNPNPFYNLCTITTSCINTPSGNDYCACRAGYRADGLDPTDPRQFRLNFPGQDYRVFVAPGIDCNTLCTTPFPGPESCQEVPVKDAC